MFRKENSLLSFYLQMDLGLLVFVTTRDFLLLHDTEGQI
jgi:hypothetical protein